jgi:hypothetical protein
MLAAEAKRYGRILRPLVAMVNDVARPTLRYCHVQRLQNQISAQMRLHGPADHPAAPGVHDYRQVQETRPRRDVGDVSDPELVTSGRDKVTLHQVRRQARISVPRRRAPFSCAA